MTDTTMPNEEGLYSEKELEDLLARKLTEQQLHAMERRFGTMEQNITASFAELRTSNKTLEATIERHNRQVDKCRSDLRDEIERDFATKSELQELRSDFRILTSKITTAVTVATLVIQLAFKFWG